ncbi:peptidylprolyl isomerase [Flexivirga oryzae]|uniref:Peptidyl-prolyl cis-trans isomerase n=1 Tax=Flexivirga oryzae TaxID=1794944 RepID=A0A839N985_9MICO|nr:peptidylprolyl isomerase [Flexivirga oryzae]MBB2891765.1 peptidyl-prolyl cis-trans isomerase B (cyclophilin B) [Flexivirga oryzae]
MRLNRTRSVLGVACLLSVVGLSACGSSTANPGGSGTGAASTSATLGVVGTSLHCAKPPAPAASAPQLQLPSKRTAQGKTFTAVLQTSCGNVTFELYGDKAPQTVASFLQLAKSYWDDSPCHRLTTQGIYVLQCGDPTGTGTGSTGYGFGIENAPENGDYPAGTVAMARGDDPDSNGGQFFIVYKDTQLPTNTGGYSIFGKVVDGMDIVNAVAKTGTNSSTGDGAPTQPISILKVTVTEKKKA